MPLSVNLNNLGVFASVKMANGTSGDAIVQLNKQSGGQRLESTRTYKFLARTSSAEKQANNDVRTQLLSSLAKALDYKGGIDKKFLDYLGKTLGKDVIKTKDFKLDANGKVVSGRPLTERRISAIVDKLESLSQKKGANPRSVLLVNSATSSIVDDQGEKSELTIDQCRAFKAKLKQAFNGADLSTIRQQMFDKSQQEANVAAFLKALGTATGKTVHFGEGVRSPVVLMVNALKALQDIPAARTSLAEQAAVRMSEDWVEINYEDFDKEVTAAEVKDGFDFDKADVFLNAENKEEIRKDPVGKGTVAVDYPDDVKELAGAFNGQYKLVGDDELKTDVLESFIDRKFTIEIDGKEFSIKNGNAGDFNEAFKQFIGEDKKIGSTMNSFFKSESIGSSHDKPTDPLSLAPDAKIGYCPHKQKLSLSRNKDGSFRMTLQIYTKDMNQIEMYRPMKEKSDPNSPSVNLPVKYRRMGDLRGDFMSYQYSLDVKEVSDGVQVKGVGDHPVFVKFNLSGKYELDKNWLEALPGMVLDGKYKDMLGE